MLQEIADPIHTLTDRIKMTLHLAILVIINDDEIF